MTPLNLDPNVNYLAQDSGTVHVPEWRKSLAAFGDETAALGSGLVALGAQAVGATDTRDKALADYQQSMEAAQSGWQAPTVPTIEDIKLTEEGGLGRLGSYVAYQLPKGLAQLATTIIGGGAGGMAAKGLAKQGIKELAKAEMATMGAELAAKQASKAFVANAAAGQLTNMAERAAGQQAIKQLAARQLTGMQLGAGAAIYGQETGQMFGQMANDPEIGPDKALLPALAGGAASSVLEYTPFHLAGKALGLGKDTLRTVIKGNVALSKRALELANKVGKGAAAGAAVEGITEGMQQLVQQAAEKYAKEDPEWLGLPKDEKEWSEVWNSVAAGALVGGVAGGALGPFTGDRRQKADVPPPAAATTPVVPPTGTPTPPPPVAPVQPPVLTPTAPTAGASPAAPTPPAPRPTWAEFTAANGVTGIKPSDPRYPALFEEFKALRAQRGSSLPDNAPPQAAEVPPTTSEPNGQETTQAPAAGTGLAPTAPQPQGPTPAETTAPATGAAGAEVAPNLLLPSEPTNAEPIPSAVPVYENVQRLGEQGGQEVQVPAEEGGKGVREGGQAQGIELGVLESRGSASPTVSAVRYTVNGRGLLNNQVLNRDKLTDDEDAELTELLDFGLQQPSGVAANQAFGFTPEGEKQHARLIKLLQKAAIGPVKREVVRLSPTWESGDGQVAGMLESRDSPSKPARVYEQADGHISFGNESVIGQAKRLSEDDDIVLEYPELEGALYLQNIDRQWNGKNGRATAALKAFLDYADKKGERIALTVSSGGNLKNGELRAWYERHGFKSIDPYLPNRMIREPREMQAAVEGDILESRTTTPTHTTIDFVSSTDAVLGQGWTQRAIDAGILEVNEVSAPDAAHGNYNLTTGIFTVNLDKIPQGQSAFDVLLHEGSHAGMQRMLGRQFEAFHTDLVKLQPTSATARTAFAQAADGLIDAYNRGKDPKSDLYFPHRLAEKGISNADLQVEVARVREFLQRRHPDKLREEDIAYYVQLASSANVAEQGYWKRLKAAIQAWIAGTSFGKAMAAIGWRPEMSPLLAVELAKQATKRTLERAELVEQLVGDRVHALRQVPAGVRLAMMEGKEDVLESRTDTAAFRNWFGDSKVVGEDGEPLVVYHGTTKDIKSNIFDKSAPKSTKGGALRDAFYFASSRLASGYALGPAEIAGLSGDQAAVDAALEGANVVPVYLALKNPLIIDAEGRNWLEIFPEAIDRAETHKHDGVIVHNLLDQPHWFSSAKPETVYVAFNANQIKSAIGNRGTWGPNNPNILESRSELGDPGYWRSGLREAVASATQTKMAPQQWLGWLKAQPRVRAEEIEDVGLKDWLEAQQGSVTKGEVERFVRDGGVQVEEITKGQQTIPNWVALDIGDDRWHVQDENGRQVGTAYDVGTEEEAIRQLAQERLDGGTKYSDRVLPGGQNYRELLVTIPRATIAPAEIYGYRESTSEPGAWELYNTTTGKVRRGISFASENMAAQAAATINAPKVDTSKDFTSSHYSEPNILVHLRFNERVDAEGKRVLFVEEVQSDWHQKGREEGYIGQLSEADSDLLEQLRAKNRRGPALTSEEQAQLTALRQKEIETQGSVPSAPMKSTGTWAMLGMKRAIRWAAENGFDKVAWTPGEVQAERYDLAKQISKLSYKDNTDGTYHVTALAINNSLALDETVAEKDLSSIVGKEIAEKIINGEGKQNPKQSIEAEYRVLSGLDLRVGGEGMKGFYDKILPAEMGKYVKRFDKAAKVGEATIATPGYEQGEEQVVWSVDLPPALRDEAIAGQLLYSLPPVRDWGKETTWWTNPVAAHLEDRLQPGVFNKVFTSLVDGFEDVRHWSRDAYRALDEQKNRMGAIHEIVKREYLEPLRGLVARYEVAPADQALARRMQRATGQEPEDLSAVEMVGHQLLARHVVLDGKVDGATNVNEYLALRAARKALSDLCKVLGGTPEGQALTAAIKAANGNSVVVGKLSRREAQRIFIAHVRQHPQWQRVEQLRADIASEQLSPTDTVVAATELEKLLNKKGSVALLAENWFKMQRRASGYSTAVAGSREYLEDQSEGFLNASELYNAGVQNSKTFKEIADLSDRLSAFQLKTLVGDGKTGILTQEAADRLARAYPHWVPDRRADFDFDAMVEDTLRRPRRGLNKLMTRKGAVNNPGAVHVLQNHLAAGFLAGSAVTRNEMLNRVADVIYADRDAWKERFTIGDERQHEGDVAFLRNGKELFLIPAVNKTGGVNLRAVALVRLINKMDAKPMEGPMKVMSWVNNWIRWSNVSASPLFLAASAPRDYLTAALNLQAGEAAEFSKRILSPAMYKSSIKALFAVYTQNKRQKGVSAEQDAMIELVEDFEKYGGKTGFTQSLKPMDSLSWRSFEAQVGRRTGKQRAVVENGRAVLEWIENLNITQENTMRLSTYRVMREEFQKQGMSEEKAKSKAAELARNLTTNFTRRGAHIDTINTWWLFYNATVQGNWQIVQNLFLNPNKAGQRRLQKAVAGTILLSFVVDQIGRALADDDEWDKVSAYDKEKKMQFPLAIGGTYISVPSPWVYNIFWRVGSLLGEVSAGVTKPQDALLDITGMIATSMDPIGTGAAFTTGMLNQPGVTMLQAISPSAADPFMQIVENRDFMGNPLGPTGFAGASSRPDAYLAWDTTPTGFKHVAEFVNSVTGGNVAESGKIDLRPSTYKVMADFLGGSIGRFGVDVAQTMGLLPGENIFEREGPREIPLVKLFTATPDNSMAVSLYHDRMAQVFSAKRLEKMYGEGPERDPQKLAQVQRDRAAVLRMVPQAEDVERQIKSLRKAMRSAKDSQTEQTLRDRIVQLQIRFNSSFVRRVEP